MQASRAESSSHHDMTLCDRPWPLKAGMIEEVNLKNFMCHEVIDIFYFFLNKTFLGIYYL